MSAGAQQLIGLTAPVGGLEIASRDVNGDNYLDLIVTTAWLNHPVAVLLNDGRGNFTVTDPAAYTAIIRHPENVWSFPTFEVNSTAVAALARLYDVCALNHRISDAPAVPKRHASEIPSHSALGPAASSLGRAPPSVLHV